MYIYLILAFLLAFFHTNYARHYSVPEYEPEDEYRAYRAESPIFNIDRPYGKQLADKLVERYSDGYLLDSKNEQADPKLELGQASAPLWFGGVAQPSLNRDTSDESQSSGYSSYNVANLEPDANLFNRLVSIYENKAGFNDPKYGSELTQGRNNDPFSKYHHGEQPQSRKQVVLSEDGIKRNLELPSMTGSEFASSGEFSNDPAQLKSDNQVESLGQTLAEQSNGMIMKKNSEQENNGNNYTTELKKEVVIKQKDGNEIKRVESYKKSFQLKTPEVADENTGEQTRINDESSSKLLFIQQPKSSNLERVQQDAQLNQPINIRSSSTRQGKFSAITSSLGDLYFIAIVIGCSTVSIFSIIGAGYCFYRFHQQQKAAADIDYPAYGVIGPAAKEPLQPSTGNSGTNTSTASGGLQPPTGDRKLAQSAQMYHYHHQKQQMIATEKVSTRNISNSDVEDSDEENEEGDYTVYECPGLASTGEIEVKNPLFHDDLTPVTSPPINNKTTDNDQTGNQQTDNNQKSNQVSNK